MSDPQPLGVPSVWKTEGPGWQVPIDGLPPDESFNFPDSASVSRLPQVGYFPSAKDGLEAMSVERTVLGQPELLKEGFESEVGRGVFPAQAPAAKKANKSDLFFEKFALMTSSKAARVDYSPEARRAVLKLTAINFFAFLGVLGAHLGIYLAPISNPEFGSWYVGLGLLIFWAICALATLLLVNRRVQGFASVMLVIDFASFALVSGWAARYVDLSAIATSYIMVFNFAVLFVSVAWLMRVSFWAFLVTLMALTVSIVVLSIAISKWYFVLPVMIFVGVHIMLVNYELRNLITQNPSGPLESPSEFSLAYSLRFWTNVLAPKAPPALEPFPAGIPFAKHSL